MTEHLTVPVPRAFDLGAARSFYAGFEPMGGSAAAAGRGLALAFLLDGLEHAVAVELTQDGDLMHVAVTHDADVPDVGARVERQLARMLGLDADGDAWLALGARDALVGELQARFPGFFTAAFPSPYEAAIGGVIGQRTSIAQARVVRQALAKAHGERVAGLWVVPGPRALLAVDGVRGLAPAKVPWLHGIARAALDGELDADALRALGPEAAIARLQSLRGIGPWTAAHIVLRGAAPSDALPLHEPRVVRGLGVALGRADVTLAELEARADSWRPFRMWVAMLLARTLAAAGQWAAAPGDHAGRGSRARGLFERAEQRERLGGRRAADVLGRL